MIADSEPEDADHTRLDWPMMIDQFKIPALSKCLIEISEKIIRVFDPDGQTQQVRRAW